VEVELALAVVELLVAVVQGLLEVAQARFLAIGALLVGLAGGQLLLALLQPRRPLVEVATAARVALGVGDRGLQPVQLRLLGGQVELPPDEDAVFLDRSDRVVKVASDLRPWRMAACRGARTVLELGAGEAARRGLRPGVSLTQVWRSAPGSSPARPPAPASPHPS
jgi:hypothetical protein